MPSSIIRPVSQGAYGGWTLAAGATKPTACADENNGSYLYYERTSLAADTPSNKESFVLADPVLTGKTILSVVIGITILGWGGEDEAHSDENIYYPFVRLGGVDVAGIAVVPRGTGAWVDTVQTLARPGGGGWTAADLAALEAGFYYSWHHAVGFLPDDPGVSEVWGVINWAETAGGVGSMLMGAL